MLRDRWSSTITSLKGKCMRRKRVKNWQAKSDSFGRICQALQELNENDDR